MDKIDFNLIEDTLQTSKEEMRNSLQKCFDKLTNMRESNEVISADQELLQELEAQTTAISTV